jgi:putative hydrolase of the HAD superfamily
MALRVVRAICFDLDNTLWDVGPVLARAERILSDWLTRRYPKIPERFPAARILELREALVAEHPEHAHDFTFLRREALARAAHACGYERAIAADAFAIWHAARNELRPYPEVIPVLDALKRHYRLATLSNGNADLAQIGLAHHFEVSLHATELGCAKPDARTYKQLAETLALRPAEILFVGDEPHADVVGPHDAGMQTVWVCRENQEWPASLPMADARIGSLDELVPLLAIET